MFITAQLRWSQWSLKDCWQQNRSPIHIDALSLFGMQRRISIELVSAGTLDRWVYILFRKLLITIWRALCDGCAHLISSASYSICILYGGFLVAFRPFWLPVFREGGCGGSDQADMEPDCSVSSLNIYQMPAGLNSRLVLKINYVRIIVLGYSFVHVYFLLRYLFISGKIYIAQEHYVAQIGPR